MPRTASSVIDKAIKENKLWEMLLFSCAGVFVLLGSGMIIWAIVHNQPIMAGVGAIESTLFWPATAIAKQTRRTNIAIRLLAIPLERAATADEAAAMLQRVFEQNLGDAVQPKPGKGALTAEQ